MELHLKIAGVLMMTLSVMHVPFAGYFKWSQDLKNLSLINRQMMYVHTFFIALTVFLMGLLCLTMHAELVTTPFGKNICLGIFIFWFARLIIQFFVYSPLLWRGKKFETFMHVILTGVWTYLSFVFLKVYLI